LSKTQAAPREGIALLVVALTTMLAPLNSTMIAVALPRITSEFNTDLTTTGWLVTGYLIAMASLQPIAGKLGDRYGRRWFMLGGLIYFGIVSIGAALTTSLPLLIFFRVQQGVAAALALPNGTALIRELVPAERRASRFGMIGALISVSAAGGPPLGGFLIEFGGWQAVFYANLLFIVPALILGWRILPKSTRDRSKRAVAFDSWGALLLGLVLVGGAWLLIDPLSAKAKATFAENFGFPVVTVGVSIMFILFALFIWRELRYPDPVIQFRFFRSLTFVAATGGVCLSNFAMYTTFLIIPLLLTARFSWSEAEIGFALTSLFASNIAIAPLGGRLADRWGRRWPTVVGMFILALGLTPLAWFGWQVELWIMLSSLAVAGVGLGLSSAGLQSSSVESVSPKDSGVASGVFSTSRYLGSIVGSSLLAGLLGANQDRLHEIDILFMLVVIASVAAMALTLFLQDYPSPENA
jgi:EmrB/QacA subfamily drug resistance transporter